MTKTTGDSYTATIPGSMVVTPGVDYYIEVVHLAGNTSTHGNSATPYFISVGGVPERCPALLFFSIFVCAGLLATRRRFTC